MNKGTAIKKSLAVIMAVILMGVMPASTYALTPEQLDKFAQNNIMFYDPDGGDGSGCTTIAGGNNYNYKGDTVFSSTQLNAIEANRSFYEKAAEKYNFPWQILAVLHTRETNLARENPENGQGAYQLYTYTNGGKNEKAFLPAGSISDDEFQRQTDIAAEVVNSIMTSNDINSSTDSGIKSLFFHYNGVASAYIEQAKKLGFSEDEAEHGEGSPYVMNRYDERRDPTMEPTESNGTWGQIKKDGGEIEYPANMGFGAYVQYIALGGSSVECNTGTLVSGGLTLKEAEAIVQPYIDKQNETLNQKSNVDFDGVTLYYYDDCGSTLTNCVAFSRWFLAKYTNVDRGLIPAVDGGSYVSAMVNNGFEDGGHTPRAYAVFSSTAVSTGAGHTGVVLGVDEERGKIVIGEAACSGSGVSNTGFTGAKEYDLSTYQSNSYTYAYTDSVLKNIR